MSTGPFDLGDWFALLLGAAICLGVSGCFEQRGPSEPKSDTRPTCAECPYARGPNAECKEPTFYTREMTCEVQRYMYRRGDYNRAVPICNELGACPECDEREPERPCPPATVSVLGAFSEDGKIRKQEGLEHCPDVALVGDFPAGLGAF